MSTISPAGAPWSRRDRTAWVGLALAGCALLAVAWNGASNELRFEDDGVWLQLAVAGVTLAFLANAVWYLAGRRAVRRLRRSVVESAGLAGGPAGPAAPGAPAAAAVLVAAPQMKHFHLAGCQLAQGKAVEPARRAEHERAGRTPCGMCTP